MARDAVSHTAVVRMHGFGRRAEVAAVLARIDRRAATGGEAR
jgi:hypothetical protein